MFKTIKYENDKIELDVKVSYEENTVWLSQKIW